MRLTRTLLALAMFGVSFGYVEAAVVVYLRAILSPVRDATFHDQEHNDLFPLLSPQQLEAAGPRCVRLLEVEVGRELATMFMLAAAGLAIAGSFRQWLAGFMISFGVWDIFYYVFLRLLIGWPESLATWDLLFLIPAPWVGPVIAPVLVALSMTLAGIAILCCDAGNQPIRFRRTHWAMIFGGGLIVIVSFCWNSVSADGWPKPFNWPVFALGEVLGIGGFLLAMYQRRVRAAGYTARGQQ